MRWPIRGQSSHSQLKFKCMEIEIDPCDRDLPRRLPNLSTCTIFAEAGSDGMSHCEVTLSACIANGKQAQTVWADSFASFSRVGASVKI